ncbi:MAG: ClpXP protease specificity-enhancing factor SspB [Oceanicaulis sp.]
MTHRTAAIPFDGLQNEAGRYIVGKDLMGYEALAQDALRGVVRQAIERAASAGGLPGAHHFYISFKTDDPDCDLDPGLLKAYPEEMTIVLEHQFWDLGVDEDGFEVTLKFNGVPKYLGVPWRAITRFHDPSVGFRLHFDYVPPKPGEIKSGKTPETAEAEGTVVSLESFRKKD